MLLLTGISLLVPLSGLALLVFGSGEDREPPGGCDEQSRAAELVDSRHTRHIRADMSRAAAVDPRGKVTRAGR